MPKPIDLVAGILESYANRGVFKGFSQGRSRFRILWHRDQFFDLILDTRSKTLRFPVVLPNVPAASSMYREFKEFVESRQSADVSQHRRIDSRKVAIRVSNRGGNIALSLTVRSGGYEYATRKLINLVHEIYLGFLYDGPYYDYMIETFNLDPDNV